MNTKEMLNSEECQVNIPTVIVVGMHRSGTSLVSSLLQSAGMHVGEQLLGADVGNLRGHFENLDFLEFHRKILRLNAIDSTGWTLQRQIEVDSIHTEIAYRIVSQNSRNPVWGWKDPRTALFLSFWSQLLPKAKFILVYRSPWEVVDSLYRRGSDDIFRQQPDLAPKIWRNYNQSIFDLYNSCPTQCLLTNLQTIIDYPQEWIDAINKSFQLQLQSPDFSLYDASLLQKQSFNAHYSYLISHHFPEILLLYQQLEENAWLPQHQLSKLALQPCISQLCFQESAFQNWENLRRIEKEQHALTHQFQQLQEQHQQLNYQYQKLNIELEYLRERSGQIF